MMRHDPRFAVRLAALFVSLCAVMGAGGARAEGPLTRLSVDVPATGKHVFKVETAVSAEERSRGLMYRRSLAPDRGMIFDFGSDTEVTMWMRNTYIPLDMLFVRSDGIVHRVQRDTVPFSEDLISAGAPVRYVVELPAGTAKRLGIDRGARVQHEIIGR